MATNDAALRAYLLGLLPDEEATQLEERFFEEQAVFEELMLAEDDLIDEYLDEQLAPEERRAFEQRIEGSAELQRRMQARRVLTRAIHRRAATSRASAVRRTFIGLAAAAALAVIGYRLVPAPATAPAPTPVAEAVPRTSPAPPARPAAPMVLLLGAAGVRGGSTVPTAALGSAPAPLAVRVPVDGGAAGAAPFVIEDVDGAVAFRGTGRVVVEGGGRYVEAIWPAESVRAGDFILRYTVGAAEDEAFFRVRR